MSGIEPMKSWYSKEQSAAEVTLKVYKVKGHHKHWLTVGLDSHACPTIQYLSISGKKIHQFATYFCSDNFQRLIYSGYDLDKIDDINIIQLCQYFLLCNRTMSYNINVSTLILTCTSIQQNLTNGHPLLTITHFIAIAL